MGFRDTGINWNKRKEEEDLLAMHEQDMEHRRQAVQEQMSLRMSGSPLPGPGQPIMGPDIGGQLSQENARRRALAMTSEEMAQLMATGKTKVAAWNGDAGQGVGMDENQAGGTTRGFGYRKPKAGAGTAAAAKPPPPPPPDPNPPRDNGDGRRTDPDKSNPYMGDDNRWQKNMADAAMERERLSNLPPPPVYTRPDEQERREREERGMPRSIPGIDPDEERRRRLRQGFRF